MRRTRLLNLEESNSYKIVYSGFGRSRTNGRMSLILLVGAARFELTTPCAQGRCATRLRYAPTTPIVAAPARHAILNIKFW